jgi:SAM-dependent methyltransferase
MRTGIQQEETLSFFDRIARNWRQSAEGKPLEVNVIAQRNNYVLRVADSRPTHTALDVGCGTGELVHQLCKRGVAAVGVDFAPEMIKLASQKAMSERLTRSEFVCSSIFVFQPHSKFDLISANGFIEYISPEELREFLRLSYEWLSPDGALVLGSRNRLFNAFSGNDYTELELSRNTLLSLVSEALIISRSDNFRACLEDLSVYNQELPILERHPPTGIGVATRHQYTPAELIRLLQSFKFRPAGLAPIHYHGVVPRFAKAHPEIHSSIAETIDAEPEYYLIPSASSFMVHAIR